MHEQLHWVKAVVARVCRTARMRIFADGAVRAPGWLIVRPDALRVRPEFYIRRDKDGRLVTKEKKVFTTDEPYNKLINFRDGKEKADEYMAKHRRAKFVL